MSDLKKMETRVKEIEEKVELLSKGLLVLIMKDMQKESVNPMELLKELKEMVGHVKARKG